MNLTRGINLRKIAELMPGASGAEVKVSWVLQQPWGLHNALCPHSVGALWQCGRACVLYRGCAQKLACMH